MNVLVTFAVASEFAPWRKIRRFVRQPGSAFPAYAAEFPGGLLRVNLTGMGPASARRAMHSAFDSSPDFCISSGVAGALHAHLKRGEIIAARRVVELEGSASLSSDARLLAAATRNGASPAGCLLTSSQLVATREGKSRLARLADAVDMESYAVMAAAASHGVPSIAIRSISDTAAETLPLNFDSLIDAGGRVDGSKLAGALARAPHKIPALIRLGRNVHAAATKLAAFLDLYVQDLAHSQEFSTSQTDCGSEIAVEAVRA